MIKFYNNTFLSIRFFAVLSGIIFLFVASFPFPVLLIPAKISLLVLSIAVLGDAFFLYNPAVRFICFRKTPSVLSMGSDNNIYLSIRNMSSIPFTISIADEIPDQFQNRDFNIITQISGNEKRTIHYTLRPLSRGEYHFGDTVLFIKSLIGLVERRSRLSTAQTVAVYPSILLMKQLELKTFTRISHHYGIKKLRRIGHSYEFEQIKNYVRGDDYRSINWKATSRRSDLMVNQFEEEKSQQIFCILDKSRSMRMPFDGLTLLDHSINTALVLSNTALKKDDKVGLITFSNTINRLIKPDKGNRQLKNILEALYKEKEHVLESNYELLYQSTRNLIKGRSLIFLFTNFESYQALERVLPYLRRINKSHLLVVIFFENTELSNYALTNAKDTEEIYQQTMAKKMMQEKLRIVNELKKYGIQSILTKPEELPLNSINKYLELKARGMI
ncbi:MAG: DUF58 domain-containing protein [Cytophagales bacterium]|nr:DUF58 domain-containing protein [Cytophaga sp.]